VLGGETLLMAKFLFIVSSVDGHTVDISERLAEVVRSHGHEASLVTLTENTGIDLSEADRVVIGASIRYGKHRPEVSRFITENQELLEAKDGAFFSVNAVARKPEKRDADTNPYVVKFLKSLTWRPKLVGVFGGRIHYAKYGFFDRNMIRFIMWMMKGPTDLDSDTDYTDWAAVDAFGKALS